MQITIAHPIVILHRAHSKLEVSNARLSLEKKTAAVLRGAVAGPRVFDGVGPQNYFWLALFQTVAFCH